MKRIIYGIFFLLTLSPTLLKGEPKEEKHINAIMRSVGHEILLSLGDSTSLVLPIEGKNHQYRISLETKFEFVPEDLVATIRGIIDKTGISKNYVVELEKCETKEIAYSFEVDFGLQQDIVACKSRKQPFDCYAIIITLLDKSEESNTLVFAILPISLLLIFIGIGWKRRKKNLLDVGSYRFDPVNFSLYFFQEKIELTSKESNLLQVLYDNKNETVKKETLLSKVWGDEGDYVGRTLDVYISKLRKKLSSDESVKILNSRGEGYRLVVE